MKLPKRNKISKNKSFDLDVKYMQHESAIEIGKPVGFWYSCYDSWYNWLLEENMTVYLHKYIHQIELNKNILTNIDNKDKNKLLIIKNIKDFDKFNEKYKIPDPKGPILEFKNLFVYNLIDWKKVAKDFGGIEICPYLTKRRNYIWYNSWDVASGCIWNVKKIINSTKIIYEKNKNKYHKV